MIYHGSKFYNQIIPSLSRRASLDDINYISDKILDLIKNYTDRK